MNVRQALYIRTIAEEGGVTAAAKKLHISQPSLSQMLRQIEEEAGTPLFERGAQVFRPTYAGERYLHAAEVILNTNEILENELREIRGEERGRLRLGISVQRSIQLLPKVRRSLPGYIPRWSSASTRRAAPIWSRWSKAARWIWPGLRRAGQPAAGVPAAPPGAHRDPHRAEQPSGPEISFRGRDPPV